MTVPSSPSELTDHLGYWLRIVSNGVSQAFATRLSGQGVTAAEWVVLRALHGRDPMTPSRTATALGLTRGAVSKLTDRLVEKGLVKRIDDPDDRRAHTLSPTAEGTALVPILAALADANDQAFFGHLNDDDRAALERIIRQLALDHQLYAAPLA